MKSRWITLLLLAAAFSANAQLGDSCRMLLAGQPYCIRKLYTPVPEEESREKESVFNRDLEVLVRCGGQEETDAKLFLSYWMVIIDVKGERTTYDEIICHMELMKKYYDYPNLHREDMIAHLLETEKFDEEKWLVDRLLLLTLNFPPALLETFHDFAADPVNAGKTYTGLFPQFIEDHPAPKTGGSQR